MGQAPAEAVESVVTLPVDADEAWGLVSEPEHLERWLADEVDLDVVEGAEGTLALPGGDVRHVLVEEVDAPRRLRFRWWPAEGGETTLVEIAVAGGEDGARLTVREWGVDPRARHAVRAAWSSRTRACAGVLCLV